MMAGHIQTLTPVIPASPANRYKRRRGSQCLPSRAGFTFFKRLGNKVPPIAFILFALLFTASCTDTASDAKKWEVTLKKEDKNPYGTYLAYQSLAQFFPEAKIEALSAGYRYTSMNYSMQYAEDGSNLMVLSGLNFMVSETEWNELKTFVANGNELVIFCSRLDNKIETQLNQSKEVSLEEWPIKEKNNENRYALSIVPDTTKKYGYYGRSLQGYFTTIDTSTIDTTVKTEDNKTNSATATNELTADESTEDAAFYGPDTLGKTAGKSNIIRYLYGRGQITIHAAPLAISNYFLLQDGNINYLQAFWATFPYKVSHIYWQDYYNRSSEESSFDILWRYPATRWALMLTIFLAITYVLFQMKRKQRQIPIVAPLKNDSVTFVETVGRLYFNKGNHYNLAEKMIQQYLEWVRNHYYLNTNMLNEDFTRQLIMKSGQPEPTVRALIEMITEVRLRSVMFDNAYLHQLHNTIQLFYKNNTR